MKKMLRLLLTFAAAGFISACAKIESKPALVEPAGCNSGVMSYEQDIRPIINAACISCHYSGGPGSYDYTRYEVLADRVRSGRLEERLLMPLSEPLHMPQGFEMNPCNLYKLRLWIQQGFPKN